MTRAGLALLALCAAAFSVAAARQPARVNDAAITADGYPAKLSDYGFFTDLTRRAPAARVVGYDLETPLFSDYTTKQRFIYVPAGAQAKYDAKAAFDFPVGSALIKTFGYGTGAAFKPIETRLLLRRASGWVAIPYVWNADGTDALLRRAGTRLPVAFTDPSGRARQISYAVPNANQCKDCHALSGQITPIGAKARYLNHAGQLETLVRAGLLDRAPANAPRVARWDDPRAPLDARARAYLEINCAHCHNPAGAASNSGLFLELDRTDPVALGIGKRPVAAGRGSGGRDFAIAPGNPDGSILIYRLRSTDPGIAMPELGRATAHDEGIALLSEWIESPPAD
ncbi:SO2930 family diheme c-type cytochrome [Sphingomonas sp.]|uniref:SO2930 family diheme c-type cytochrome n=1 Tax=Sphingomonas sp. TaxID=28214 RepID=UPI003BAB395F